MSDGPDNKTGGDAISGAIAVVVAVVAAIFLLRLAAGIVRIAVIALVVGAVLYAAYSLLSKSSDRAMQPADDSGEIDSGPGDLAGGQREPRTPDGSAAAEPAQPIQLRWEAAVKRHDGIMREYLPFETDPVKVLTYPALTDVGEPASADFFDAMHDADALRTDAQPGAATAEAYVAAVGELARAWRTAEQNARRVGDARLDQEDRRTVAQVIKLLEHSQSAISEAEQRSYANRAFDLLSPLTDRGIVRLPPRAMRAIANKRRRELGG